MAAKFFRRGITKVFAVPTISAIAAPTATEVNAGTDITALIADITGFAFKNSPIDTPTMSSTFTGTIPGEDKTDTSTITFYEPTGTNSLRSTFAKGTSLYIVIFFAGIAGSTPAAADKAEVWPVQSTGPSRQYSMGNDAAKWMADFTPSGPPSTDAVLV